METRATNPDATAEDMFLAWFLRLPHTSDVAAAARVELARLEPLAPSDSIRRLRSMLQQVCQSSATARAGRRALRH